MEKRGEEALEIQDNGEAERQIVTPWKVEAKDGNKIDYDKLVNQFGCQRLDQSLIDRGRGPSSESLHLGHLIPFMFAKYLQDAFKVPLVIQLTDDEKCMWPEKSHRGRKPKTCEGEC
uniref:tryptophan--tRNA ligase, cytoplasmic-like n=1 Tax=Fragaria vesca subsp. vesca TaxID=101020 RepID=UPI0005C85959|nr:PREDICTED: tryptophan--tRNA ligase, cytoplasmic-like [Fragaria vesca subsp. vesca]